MTFFSLDIWFQSYKIYVFNLCNVKSDASSLRTKELIFVGLIKFFGVKDTNNLLVDWMDFE